MGPLGNPNNLDSSHPLWHPYYCHHVRRKAEEGELPLIPQSELRRLAKGRNTRVCKECKKIGKKVRAKKRDLEEVDIRTQCSAMT